MASVGIVPSRQTTTPLPQTPASGDFTNVQQFRMEVAKWAGEELKSYADYVALFSEALNASEIPDITDPRFLNRDECELYSVDQLKDLSDAIGGKVDQIISTVLAIANRDLANTREINIDVDRIVGLLENAIDRELDPSNPHSVYAFRTLLKNLINTLLLDTAFQILSSDLSDIDEAVTAYILRSKLTLDEEMLKIDRRTINTLAIEGVLDSSIGAEALTRMNAAKGRLYLEIENKAEELRIQLTNDAYQRQWDKQRIRIQALSAAPYQLPANAFAIIGSLVDKIFPDPNAFITQLPNILSTSARGYTDLMEYFQRDRFNVSETQIRTVQVYTQYLGTITENLKGIYDALAKMSTFEAS